jgi:hypothetical protein
MSNSGFKLTEGKIVFFYIFIIWLNLKVDNIIFIYRKKRMSGLRKLKYHEKKLLRKVDFFNYGKGENEHRDVKVMRRYYVQDREDYARYNKICG